MQKPQQFMQQIGILALAAITSFSFIGLGATAASAATATKITKQPKSATSYNKAKATFSVTAKGTKLKYQWSIKKKTDKSFKKITNAYKPVTGEKTATMHVKPTASYAGAKFRVVVTGSKGKKTSKAVTLTMKSVTKTSVTTQPKATKVKNGATANMEVAAKGSSLTYSWQIKKTTNTGFKTISSAYTGITGEKTKHVKVKTSKSYQGALLRVIVRGKNGTATSKSAKITLSNVAATTNTASLASASYGIDLSSWQSTGNGVTVSYNMLPSRGFKFTIARLGTSEKCAPMGTAAQRMDTAYTTHVKQARNNGLAVGHYWFNGVGKPSTDATYFVKHLSQYQPGDPLILDIESHYYTNSSGKCVRSDNWTPAMALQWVNTVKSKVSNANVYIYMAQGTLSRANWSSVAKVTRLWIARFGKNDGTKNNTYAPVIKYWSRWSIWQYTSTMNSPAVVVTKSGKKVNLDANYAMADAWTPLN